jgi:glutathione reductase (NADPH)
VLVAAAELFDDYRRMQGKGLKAEALRIDWPELMRFKKSFTDTIPHRREEEYGKAGIACFHGRARFAGTTSLEVAGEKLRGRKIVIASGQLPADLEIPGKQYLTTSDQFLDLDELPRRILLIGGGYIAFEFAHLSALAGCQVSILHRGSRPLRGFDAALVDQLLHRTRELGIEVHSKAEVRSIGTNDHGLTVAASQSGETLHLTSDLVVHAAGRVPNLKDLDLDKAGIEWDEQGVRVSDFLQSISNPMVYAAGDAAGSGSPRLSPIAGYEGTIVAANLIDGNHVRTEYRGVPTVVFTVPPLAAVGLKEDEARQRNLRFRVRHEDTSGLFPSQQIGETCSGYKVLVEEDTDRILGAHVLGTKADEVINLFALAIRMNMRATDLRHALLAYPTRGSMAIRMVKEG